VEFLKNKFFFKKKEVRRRQKRKLPGVDPPICSGECEKKVFEQRCSLNVKEKQMDGILFLVFWLGCASLHTVYDLKVRPVLRAVREESDFS